MKRLGAWPALLFFLCLGLGLSCRASDQDVAVVLSSNLEPYQEALKGFQESFGRTAPVFILAEGRPRLPAGTRLVVAIGSKAALFPYPQDTMLIYCMAPGVQVPKGRRNAIKIHTVPATLSVLSKIKQIQPSVRTLGVLWGSDATEDFLSDRTLVESSLGIKLAADRIRSVDDLPDRLRALKGKVDALWLPPDPLLVTPAAFAVLKDYSRGNHIPVYASAETLVEDGAVASLFSSYQEIGRRAGWAAQRVLEGTLERTAYYPEKLQMAVNPSFAREVGLVIPSTIVKEAVPSAP